MQIYTFEFGLVLLKNYSAEFTFYIIKDYALKPLKYHLVYFFLGVEFLHRLHTKGGCKKILILGSIEPEKPL